MQFLFANHTFDPERRELWRGSEQVALEPQVFDLLLYLIRNRDRVVSKDDLIADVWGGRIVSDSTLTSRINAARKAIGDSGEEQRLIRTVVRKGIRFVGEVKERGFSPVSMDSATPALQANLKHEIQFCTADDGVRIAYATVGQGPPLLKAANWLNHLEYDWQSPVWSDLLHELARGRRLIRYDARGNGLSDRDVGEISFQAFVSDLESVVEATGLSRFDLLGISQGCAISIAYAVRHPQRVRKLVLYGGFARGKRKRGSSSETEQADMFELLIRQGWGQDNPAFRQFFTSLFMPEATHEQMQSFNDLQRVTASGEIAARIRQAVDQIDVGELLPHVTVPTLVLHCRNDGMVPLEEGRRMAAGIRGARFVMLEGRNHVILKCNLAWRRFLDEINGFLND